MAAYSFTTIWRFEASRSDVWKAISDAESWPSWWTGVESVVELEPGQDDGVGALQRHTWKSALPYRVVFDMRVTEVVPEVSLAGNAVGELAGEGRWSLFSDGRLTTVRYEWNVCTTRAWMNLLAPVGRPIFAWNHNVVMRNGGRGLAGLLGNRRL